MTFVDVRIFNPKSSYRQSKTMPQLYTLHEDEKKNKYMNQVLQLEKWSFVPLVVTTTEGMAPLHEETYCVDSHQDEGGLQPGDV